MRTIKFGNGQDANQSVRRKLVRAFVLEGKLTATTKKIKAIKSEIQRLMTHAKRDSQSSRNYLISRVGDKRVVDVLIKDAAPVFKDRVGGYVRNIALPQRVSDASFMSRLEWVSPVVISKIEAPAAQKSSQAKAKVNKSTAKKQAAIPKRAAKMTKVKETKSVVKKRVPRIATSK